MRKVECRRVWRWALRLKGAITQFVNSSKVLFNGIDVLGSWRTHIMRENFKILSFTDDVLLFDYLSVRDYLPIKDRASKGLVEFFIAWEKNKIAVSFNQVVKWRTECYRLRKKEF